MGRYSGVTEPLAKTALLLKVEDNDGGERQRRDSWVRKGDEGVPVKGRTSQQVPSALVEGEISFLAPQVPPTTGCDGCKTEGNTEEKFCLGPFCCSSTRPSWSASKETGERAAPALGWARAIPGVSELETSHVTRAESPLRHHCHCPHYPSSSSSSSHPPSSSCPFLE